MRTIRPCGPEVIERCGKYDKRWAKAASETINSKQHHLDLITRGLGFAKKLRIVALEVPHESVGIQSEKGTEDNEESQRSDAGISDVEHLFSRLNSAGTVLRGEELAYSMIKAYWPGIAQSFAALTPLPMAEAYLATMGTRAALIDSKEQANTEGKGTVSKLPPEQTVTTVRSLARVKERRGTVEKYFGIGGNLEDFDLRKDLQLVDGWLLYRNKKADFGLPPVLRTAIAQESPEVFLLLLCLAQLARKRSLPHDAIEALRKPIVALATTLHFFGIERALAINRIFGKLMVQIAGLDPQAFHDILSDCLEFEGGKRGVLKILSPKDLGDLIPEAQVSDNFEVWSFWKLMMENLTGHEVKAKQEKYDFFNRVKKSRSLLLFAQRSYLNKTFKDYDPSVPDMWIEHNRPWDYDHILPAAKTYREAKAKTCKNALDEWMNTIGNLRAWRLEENRSKSAELAKDYIIPADYAYSLLEDDEDCANFSLANIADPDGSAKFMNAARNRLLRIYSSWFDELEISNLCPWTGRVPV